MMDLWGFFTRNSLHAKRVAFVALLLVVALLEAPMPAAAGEGPEDLNALLKGEYAGTHSMICMESSAGFDPVTLVLEPFIGPGPFSYRQVFYSVRGTTTYNGDGTGTSSIRSMAITSSPFFTPGASLTNESDSQCDLTYVVHSDGTVNQESNCSYRVITGPFAGITGTVSTRGLHQLVQPHTLLIGHADQPSVEILTASAGASPRYRVCTNSGVSIKKTQD